MAAPLPNLESLVLYKNRPARVVRLDSKKITIEILGGKNLSVRIKDVIPLHPGPAGQLVELQAVNDELLTAWELLTGESTTISELAELVFGEYNPSTAWASWQLVLDGLYFKGEPQNLSVCTVEEVENEKALRDRKLAEEAAWQEFINRVDHGEYLEEDEIYLEDVVRLGIGERDGSRVLKALKLTESPEHAHAFLLKIGYWDQQVNPYPIRSRLPLLSPQLPVEFIGDGERRDLTHLQSFAIDDEGSNDPDDALSIEDGRLWVHIADASAMVPPSSPADSEALSRGATLYLPENTVTMLPPEVIEKLALGLNEQSPALSFGMDISDSGEVLGLEIVPSWVKVTRLTYDEVESRLSEPILGQLNDYALLSRKRRLENGAVELSLPEIKIRTVDGEVYIRPLPSLQSRELVREAMLMTGQAVAQYAVEHEIPMPFTTQEMPESYELDGETLSQMFAIRNRLRASQRKVHPGSHGGLGLDEYVQATSPLRRYLDLLVHQQLRAHISGSVPMHAEEILDRIGAIDEVVGSIRRAERNSNQHWTLVYLMQNPGWRGEAVVVGQRGARYQCLIPELAMDAGIYLGKDVELDTIVELSVEGIDLAFLKADFRLVE